MRIAVVHSFYQSLEPSGENAVVRDQVSALSEAGHDVRLVARHSDDLAGRRGYQVRSALITLTGRGPKPSASFGSSWTPDVVHVHNTFPNWGTDWIEPWSSRTVITLHNYRSVCAAATLFRDGHACHDCLRTPVLPALRHACYRDSRLKTLPLAVAARANGSLGQIPRTARRVIALNTTAQALFQEEFGRSIDVVPNFVGDPIPGPGTGPSNWAFIGRLTQVKGIIELLQRWPGSRTIDVFGGGPLAGEVQEIASNSGGSIRYRGLLERDEIRSRLGSYRGLIVPSLWPEGLPTVTLEGLAAGVPLLLSDRISAASEMVGRGVGVMFSPTDSNSLNVALVAIERERAGMSRAARLLFTQRYSRGAWLEAVQHIYDTVTG